MDNVIDLVAMGTANVAIIAQANNIKTCMAKMSDDYKNLSTCWQSTRFVDDVAKPYNTANEKINQFQTLLVHDLPKCFGANYENMKAWNESRNAKEPESIMAVTVEKIPESVDNGKIVVNWSKTGVLASDAIQQMKSVKESADKIIEAIGGFKWETTESTNLKRNLEQCASEVSAEFQKLTKTMNDIIEAASKQFKAAVTAGAGKTTA